MFSALATVLFPTAIAAALWALYALISWQNATRNRENILREALKNARVEASKAEHHCASLLSEKAALKQQVSDLTEILAELSSEIAEAQNQGNPGKTVSPRILKFPIPSQKARNHEFVEGM